MPTKIQDRFFRNLGNGAFEELGEEAGPGWRKRFAAADALSGILTNDGEVDILIVNLNEPPSLLRNDLKGNQELAESKAGRSQIQPERDWSQSFGRTTAAKCRRRR